MPASNAAGIAFAYRDTPSSYWANVEKVADNFNLTFSLGLTADDAGKVEDVLWEGPAFDAGLTTGATVLQVNGADYSPDILRGAVGGGPLELRVRSGKHERSVVIATAGGHRFPHLETIGEGRHLLDEILKPRRERKSND